MIVGFMLELAGTARAELATPMDGQVYDSNLLIWWLEDANLAGSLCLSDPDGVWDRFNPVNFTKQEICNQSGVMERRDGQPFIDHLNAENYLGFSNWRLPETPTPDPSCSVQAGQNSYGIGCTGSEMGNLHYVSLGNLGEDCQPDCLVNTGPFQNMQDGLSYLSGTIGLSSNYEFFFASGAQGETSPMFHQTWVWPVHDDSVFIDGFEGNL